MARELEPGWKLAHHRQFLSKPNRLDPRAPELLSACC